MSAVCVAALIACGGGGGGDDGGEAEPPSPTLFNGPYGYSGFSAWMGSGPATHYSRRGWLIAGGDGSFSCEYYLNDGTFVHSEDLDHEYRIGVGRSLEFLSGGTRYASGRIAASGRYANLAYMDAGTVPGIIVNVEAGIDYAESDLSHTYRGCGIEYHPGTDTARATTGDYTFDGAGGWSGTYTVNIEGAVYPGQVHGPGAYDILATGHTTSVYESGFTLGGQLSRDRDVLTVAGGQLDGTDLYHTVFVRGGTGMTASSLSGSYHIVGIWYDYRTNIQDWIAVSGTWTADGAGGYSAVLVNNDRTNITASYTETGTYAVTGAGALTITRSTGETFTGGLSGDRTFAAFGGGTSQLSMPSLFVLVK